MPERIPQSTTIRVPLQAYLSTDHVSAATGKTIAITISKNGAAYGNPSAGATNATEIASGSYYVDLSTTDTGTLGPLFVKGSVSGVDDVIVIYNVVSASTGGLTNLDAAISSRMASYTQPTGFLTATFPSTVASTTNITAASGVALTSAYDLAKTAAQAGDVMKVSSGTGANQISLSSGLVTVGTNNDKTGYALTQSFPSNFASLGISATGHISNVDTLTTYTGNTPQTGDAYARLGAPVNASISADIAAVKSDSGGIKTKTDNLPASPAATSDIPTAAQVRAEMDSNSTKLAHLDADVSTRSTYAGADTSGTTTLLSRLTSTRAGLLDHLDADISSVPTAAENADALLDASDAIESGLTPRGAIRLTAAALVGKLSGGATTTNTFRNAVADSKDRIVATVDADGNRTAITTDVS